MSEEMKKWVGRVAVVTGASNSTGKAVVDTLVREGMTVVGVDDGPDFDKVQNFADFLKSEGALGTLQPFRCDIKSSEGVRKLFNSIKTDPDLEGVDVCVHCAVCALGESILEGHPETWKEMVETNVLAVAYVTQETVKCMKERDVDNGHIIFINSLCGHRLVPGNKALHFFSATKFAQRALLEGLRYELRMEDSKIRASAISPGVIETDVIHKIFDSDEEQARRHLGEKKYLDVKDVAKGIVYILEQPPHVTIHDILMRSTDQIP